MCVFEPSFRPSSDHQCKNEHIIQEIIMGLMYGMYCPGCVTVRVCSGGRSRKWSSCCWGLLSIWLWSSSPTALYGGAWGTIGHLSTGTSSDWIWLSLWELLRAVSWSHRADHLLWRAWRSGMMSRSRLDDKWREGGGCFSSSVWFDRSMQSVTDLLSLWEPDHTRSPQARSWWGLFFKWGSDHSVLKSFEPTTTIQAKLSLALALALKSLKIYSYRLACWYW